MSKRRQSIAACTAEMPKKQKQLETEESTDTKPISELSDKQLRTALSKLGETPGPILPSTRYLYEGLLEKHRKGDLQVPKPAPDTSVKKEKVPAARVSKKPTPIKTELKSPKKELKSPNKSPVRLSASILEDEIDNEEVLEPPTDKQIRAKLVAAGETPGPINKETRPFYLELIAKHEQDSIKHDNGGIAQQNTTKRASSKNSNAFNAIMSSTKFNSPQSSRTMMSPNLSSTRHDTPARDTKPRKSKVSQRNTLLDYPEEEEGMEIDRPPTVSYIKSPYKKTRRSVCKEAFEDTDFVIFAPSVQLPVLRSFYIDIHNNGVQAIVTQDCSAVPLLKVVKASEQCCKIYAGITVSSIAEGKTAVSNAASCGAHAVVLSLAKYQCSDSTAVARAIAQVMEEQLTTSYFYYHNSLTKACPVQISKYLLKQGTGYQGIFISTDTLNLLKLEELGIKIHETEPNNILRSLAHGIDSVANFEGIVAMPLMRKLKEEYYEGNTSECCRLQLMICSLVKLLTKYGDLLPSLHSAVKLVNMSAGTLPTPLLPLPHEVPLLKELTDMNIDKWKDILL